MIVEMEEYGIDSPIALCGWLVCKKSWRVALLRRIG